MTSRFGMDAYDEKLVFIFCNRKRNSIKVLRYDRNGFVLAAKTLLDKMKFQWPRSEDELILLRTLPDEKVAEINAQKLLIEKQRIQIENMTQALSHARKKMFGTSSEKIQADGQTDDSLW